MLILITCPNPPWVIGGVERVVGEIAKRLAKENEVIIYTKAKMTKTKNWKGVTVKTFKNDAIFFSLRMIFEMKKKSSEFDIIHTHSLSTAIPFETFLAVNSDKLVVSTHYHPTGSTAIFDLLKKLYDQIFCKRILKKAKKIICVSETERTNIKRKFGIENEKLMIIPNGVDIEAINASKAFDLGKKITLLLYVGRLEKYKNVHLIIKSMPYMLATYKLIIIGGGPYKTKLLQLIASLQLQDKVQILSGLTDEEIFRWYKTCSLAINLSSQEAFGITVIESLAAGKPVLVNNQTALIEMAQKFEMVNAVDAERLDSQELAKLITTQAKKNVQQSPMVELAKYRWDSITEQVEEVYEDVYN